ncbi:MAG: endolytic transglycosylase MltG [Steroidobacteraceae bacterium]
MRRLLRRLALLAALLGCLLGLWLHLEHQMDQPSAAGQPVRIEVLQGEPLRTILARLQQQGALRHPREVAWYLRLHRLQPRVQAGNYEIPPHASARAVLDQLVAGRVLLEQLTVVEGWRFADLRHALDTDAALTHTLRGMSDQAVMQELGHADEAAEGRFFPDTYRFAGGTPDRRILELAYERMRRELQQAWDTRAADLPLATPTDALILASIVEKETGREDERPMVAAVFVNRLRRGMRLQSDPTVIYGLGESYDGNIHTRDLETDTPYNSYTRAGLPPTPIALPGSASLRAALHPADTDVLYFVATGNGDGSHQFSATLEQHDVALRAYLHRIGADARAHKPATP